MVLRGCEVLSTLLSLGFSPIFVCVLMVLVWTGSVWPPLLSDPLLECSSRESWMEGQRVYLSLVMQLAEHILPIFECVSLRCH